MKKKEVEASLCRCDCSLVPASSVSGRSDQRLETRPQTQFQIVEHFATYNLSPLKSFHPV